MAGISKQAIPLPLAIGIDTKVDPWQLDLGKFVSLNNAVYTTDKRLQKRNGFALQSVLETPASTLTTYRDALTAIGDTDLFSYSPEVGQWYNKGPIVSVSLRADTLVRSASNQSAPDVAVSSNGLICTVWADSDGFSKYQISDGASVQVIVQPVNLPATATKARAFALGRYFIVTYLVTVTATTHLQYIAIPLSDPATPQAAMDIATDIVDLATGYDGYVASNNLFFSYGAVGSEIRTGHITDALVVWSPKIITGYTSTYISVTADTTSTNPVIWVSFFDTSVDKIYSVAYTYNVLTNALTLLLATTQILASVANTANLTSVASSGVNTIFYETAADYGYTIPGYAGNAVSNYVNKITVTSGGSVGSSSGALRGVALASKAFIANSGQYYLMVAYGSNSVNNQNYQPTYFLVDGSGGVISKLAYSNGGGYPSSYVLPGVNISDDTVYIGYRFKDLTTPVNKSADTAPQTQVAGIYSQTGINLVTYAFNAQQIADIEIANDLHMTGGMVWMYDGVKPIEHGFHLWPEDIYNSWSATGGAIVAKPDGSTNTNAYAYQVTYEWTDAQGNLHRSAPSVPIFVTTTGAGTTGSITLKIPTYRLTYKTGANLVRIVIYRWSVNQQAYYQVTSVTSPTLNDTTVDSITYVDTLADSSIIGNQLIYTTGGILENIAAPALADQALFKSRLVGINAEDRNQLWASKQVIPTVPVEFSDIITIYVAPSTGAQGSTGECTAVTAMDDKLIIFKRDAIYYVAGTGPDNLGNNNDFSEPQFITSTVGCTNKHSIVFIPQGIMFQSDKGIWILTRGLETQYIGAPVEAQNGATVLSATGIPDTNQVRFTLDNGTTLMYDYYYNRWGYFSGIPAVSSILYEGLHTYINSSGEVFQETPGLYMDGTHPVLMSFTTGWCSLAGLQGYQRLYWLLLLANYETPHTLEVSVAYDFNDNPLDFMMINPDNYNAPYGDAAGEYGDESPYGGNDTVEDWRVFVSKQKCQSFQITVQEQFDPQFSTVPGPGLTFSGISLVAGMKKTYRTQSAARSTGTAGQSQP